MELLLKDKVALREHIIRVLHEKTTGNRIFSREEIERGTAAGVLLLLGPKPNKRNASGEPCLILNKRSLKVRQPGDLCCPGGSVRPGLDPHLAKLLSLPIASLGRWPYWSQWKKTWPQAAGSLALLWATSLRESFEEMRLNPFGVRFLGPLPPQSLVMFQRKIYPMVAWIQRQKRFFPNWEVEKIVFIPLRDLLSPAGYRRYRVRMEIHPNSSASDSIQDFPCFRFETDDETELLWGATYRITTVFLEYVFGFKSPAFEDLPAVEGALDETYLTGQR